MDLKDIFIDWIEREAKKHLGDDSFTVGKIAGTYKQGFESQSVVDALTSINKTLKDVFKRHGDKEDGEV